MGDADWSVVLGGLAGGSELAAEFMAGHRRGGGRERGKGRRYFGLATGAGGITEDSRADSVTAASVMPVAGSATATQPATATTPRGKRRGLLFTRRVSPK